MYRQASPYSILSGASLLIEFNFSTSSILRHAFPTHVWKPWKFYRSPASAWKLLASSLNQGDPATRDLLQLYLEDIGKQLNITSIEHWQYVNQRQLPTRVVQQLKHFQGLARLLPRIYPQHKWKFRPKSSNKAIDTQKLLKKLADQMLEVRCLTKIWRVFLKVFEFLNGLVALISNWLVQLNPQHKHHLLFSELLPPRQ